MGHTFKESSNSSPRAFTGAVALSSHVWREVKGACRLTTGQLPDCAAAGAKSYTTQTSANHEQMLTSHRFLTFA